MENKCNCFSCRNHNNKDRLYGYYYGVHEAYKLVASLLKKYGVESTKFTEENLGGLLAYCEMVEEFTLTGLNELETKLNERVTK